MAKNTLHWLDKECCGSRTDETIQPVLISTDLNDFLFYTLSDRRGFYYVFNTIYDIHLHWSGLVNQYEFTCGSEKDLIEYLENC